MRNSISFDLHRLKLLLSVLNAGAAYGIASAAIALLVTLFKTARQVQQAASLRLATTLSTVLLRDGTFMMFVDRASTDRSMSLGSMFFLSVFPLNPDEECMRSLLAPKSV